MSKTIPVRSDRCGLDELFLSYETGDAERARLALGPGWTRQWTATWQVPGGDRELVTRLLRGECEWCGQRAEVETHQVCKLADLTRPGQQPPPWTALMAKMRRKTLIVCAPCHQAIHGGKPAATHT
jgi:hypothetical protein